MSSSDTTQRVEIDLGSLGWRSVFHRNCPGSGFAQGIVGPDGPRDADESWHRLPDGEEIRAWKCAHCGVRFFAGTDSQHRITVVPRA